MTDPVLIVSFRQSLRSCTNCSLHTIATQPIPWTGDLSPRYAVLGEAPGRTEDARGECFVGDSGAILRHWFKQVGIDIRDVTFLNACACYPKRTPMTPEIDACRKWVHGQLDFIRPEILITMGRVAFQSIRGGLKRPELQSVHGKPLFHPRYKIPVWPTYHPSAYLHGRNLTYEKKITTDLRQLVEWDGEPLDMCYVCGDTLYRYDDWAIGMCARHARIQGELFPEMETTA